MCTACFQVNALKEAGIYEKTAIIFGSKHGNSPINHTALVRVSFPVRCIPLATLYCLSTTDASHAVFFAEL